MEQLEDRSLLSLWFQQASVPVMLPDTGDQFGSAVAIDGETMVLGAPYDDVGGEDSGAAYVYTRKEGVWIQQARLNAYDGGDHDHFGASVSVAGNTIVVGAPSVWEGPYLFSGSAYVFVGDGANWTQQAKLTAPQYEPWNAYGYSVCISGDTIVVGAPRDNTAAGEDAGSAYVYVRSGVNWVQQQQLTAADGAEGDVLGISVSLDEDTVVGGARGFEDSPSAYFG